MIQAVQNGKRFSPERDLLEVFPLVVGGAAMAMARNTMPPAVRDFAAATGVTDPDATAACIAIAEFINIARSQAFVRDDLAAAYIRSGLDKVPQAAAVALYSNIGMALTNAFFRFAREALPTHVTTPGIDGMTELLLRAAHAGAAPDPHSQARRAAEMGAAARRHEEDVRG